MSAAQIEQYRRDGVLFPIPSLPADETAQAQLHFRWAYELATHPRILDAVEAVLGPDLLVWTVDNGCMRVVPGSHRQPILQHKDTYAPDNLLSRGQEVQAEVDEKHAVDIVLKAGEMSLLPAPPALSTDAALAAQQAAARRLLTALRGATGHYAAGAASR